MFLKIKRSLMWEIITKKKYKILKYILNLFCSFRFQYIYHEQFVGLFLYKKVISQSRLLRNRNANYNKKVSSTSVESSLRANLFLIRPLNIPLTLLVEPCQPAAISVFLSRARLEESSQILWLVVFEQSL